MLLLKRSLFLSRSASQSYFSVASTTSFGELISAVFDDTGVTLVLSWKGKLLWWGCKYTNKSIIFLQLLDLLNSNGKIKKLNKFNYQSVTHIFLQFRKNVMVLSVVEILVTANSPNSISRADSGIITGNFFTALPNFLLAVAPTSYTKFMHSSILG